MDELNVTATPVVDGEEVVVAPEVTEAAEGEVVVEAEAPATEETVEEIAA